MPNFLQCGRTFNKTCQKGRVPTLNLACIGAKGALRKLKAGQLKLDVNGSALRGGADALSSQGFDPLPTQRVPLCTILRYPFFAGHFFASN